ncbi:hypothetical protein Golomagni_08269, partial [Golovinomyces magnicellulatus]
ALRFPEPALPPPSTRTHALMDNLWTRRTNSNKLSLTTPANADSSRNATFSKRHGGDIQGHGKNSPFNTPGGSVASPTSGASTAFGLGSGAFASFGSAKTPKTPGNPFDSAMGSAMSKQNAKDGSRPGANAMGSISETMRSGAAGQNHQLKDAWSFWYRPPISKAHGYIEYENTLHGIATVQTAEEFWGVYTHLKRPSKLPVVSDYHLFKRDIRPIWEDDVNRKGGKWVVRMKKGVADRYWEDLLLALIGDQFGDAGEEVCGAVLSMRNGEDILSIWTRTDGGRVLKIR